MIKNIKPKKFVLDNAYLEEEFFEDVVLIGIVSPKQPYQAIWHINEKLNVSFEKNHDHERVVNNTYFEVFSYLEPEKLRENIIFSNRNKQHYLIPEAKNIDYIWMLKGGHEIQQQKSFLLEFLPKISIISYSFEINPEIIKNKMNLVL